MEEEKHNLHGQGYDSKPGGLFLPAGVLLGLGFGFLVENVPAGLLIGVGAGFAAFALALLVKR